MRFDFETRDHYDKAAQDVAYLKRLDEYALNRVSDWAEELWAADVCQAVNLMDWNPNYPYPDEYRNGREVEYWLGNEHQAQKCAKVRKAIEQIRNPAPPPPPPLTTSRTIPDETLNQWLLEAINYEAFIETLTRYEQEVLDYHALIYQLRIYNEYIPADMTFGTDEGFAEFGRRSEKLSNETYYENVLALRKRLKAVLNPVPAPPPRKENTRKESNDKRLIIDYFKATLNDEATKEMGKRKPRPVEEIVRAAINTTLTQKNRSEKTLGRYLRDLGESATLMEYGRQLVRQKLIPN